MTAARSQAATCVELVEELPRVALVPRRGEHDHGLVLAGEREQLVRHGERVEEE